MSDTQTEDQPTKKTSKLPLVIGLVLAVLGGGGGFWATYSGMANSLLGVGESPDGADQHETDRISGDDVDATANGRAAAAAEVEFVALDPITINFGNRDQPRHLRFSAQLEVSPENMAAVQRLQPRIIDVLNIYLRALEPHELEEPAALLRLRGQMLRRVQIVTGAGMVNDLLVMEFVFI